MNNNFLGIRGLYKTHMDGLKPFNSKSVTYTYIGYSEHNSRGQPIVRHRHATTHRTPHPSCAHPPDDRYRCGGSVLTITYQTMNKLNVVVVCQRF